MTEIEGHRKGCPMLDEPLHHGCRVLADDTIERYTAPTYDVLRAENGSLARMYALCEDKLRERTGRLNQAEAENERIRAENRSLAQRRVDMAENERLRAELATNREVMDLQHRNRLNVEAENERLRAEKIEWSDVATQERQEVERLLRAMDARTESTEHAYAELHEAKAENERLQSTLTEFQDRLTMIETREAGLIDQHGTIARLRAVIEAYLENDSQANWDAMAAEVSSEPRV